MQPEPKVPPPSQAPGLSFGAACPFSIQDYPRVLLAHGGGGTLMRQLLEKMILPAFHGPPDELGKTAPGTVSSNDSRVLSTDHDSCLFEIGGQRLAFTSDSYVVRPLVFPGGDVGSLAVHGTVNDLAMAGARPLYLSAGFIIEEGLPMDTLWRIVTSMRRAADRAGVRIVTGDTKVVDKGKGDGLFINTSGVGRIEHTLTISPGSIRAGDAVLVSGDLGRHGMAIMAVREGLEFESSIESDSAPLADLVLALLQARLEIHCLRDLTRGGLTSVLNELAESSGCTISVEEKRIPVRDDVRAACEILGFDPLQVACEGRFALFLPEAQAEAALAVMRRHPLGADACVVGHVAPPRNARVLLRSLIGAERILAMGSGEQLPRIC